MNRFSLLAIPVLAALPLLAGAVPVAARGEVGVAAAVNQQARRMPPGAPARTVVLGDTLIFKERIRTEGQGLVQILLRDGSTFTVGANSDLVIDEFVYDPQAGSGKLVASFGKGVARFVGGRLSKNPGGVTVKTPVGTIGIRGGIANIEVEGATGRFSLLFGNELSFLGPDGASRRIFERGYTLSVSQGDDGTPSTRIRPTSAGDLANVQGRLSGSAGQSGGSRNPPTDQSVGNAPVGAVNSGQPVTSVMPPPKPVVVASTTIEDGDRVLGDIVHNANNEVIREEAGGGTGDGTGGGTGEGSTIQVRVLSSGQSYQPSWSGTPISDPGGQDLIGGTPDTDRTVGFTVSADGTQMTGVIDGETLTMPLPSADEAVFRAVTSAGRTVTGSVYRSGDHFIAFAFFEEISASVLALDDPFFGFWGEATDFEAFNAANDHGQVRSYTLTANALHSFRTGSTHSLYFLNPLAADALGAGFLDGVRTSDLLVVSTQHLEDGDPRYLVASMNIQGSGGGQKSAISMSAGSIFRDGGNIDQLGGPRRGGYRAEATDPSVLYSGPVTSLPSAGGAHFFGDNADTFVIGHDVGALDPGNDHAVPGPLPYGSAAEAVSGYVHVADLSSVSPVADFTRTTRSLSGFGAGMVESTSTYGTPVPFWSNIPNDLRLSFDAGESSAGAMMRIGDNTQRSPYLAALTIGFGDNLNETGGNGPSAFVDDDRYGLAHNTAATTLELDGGYGTVGPAGGGGPLSYMIPSTLVRGGDDALFQSVSRCTCAFLEWGYWGTRVETDSSQAGIGESRSNVHLGTWVAGNTPTFGQLPISGTATYTGHAVGSVASGSPTAPAQYLAAGNFALTYGFASRTGTAAITNFDGRNFTGSVAQPVEIFSGSANHFSGTLTQVGGPVSGTLNGAFVSGPASVAQGVIGSFGLSDPGNNWMASGIVVGDSITGPTGTEGPGGLVGPGGGGLQ